MATFPGSGGSGTIPDNTVVVDAITGFLETADGGQIVESSVATMADLIALTDDAVYAGRSIVVENPGDNVSNYFPAKAFRMNSRWYLENGDALLYAAAPKQRFTWPAAAWDAGGFTLTSAASGAQTTVTSTTAATVGLTQAIQLVGGEYPYVYVSGSVPATGTVDWPVGWVKIMDMSAAASPGGTYLTLLYPYDANLKDPIISEIGGTSKAPALVISIPPLSETGGYEIFLSGKNTVAANEHRIRAYAAAVGTTMSQLYTQDGAVPVSGCMISCNDATATPYGVRGGLQNSGATNINMTVGPPISTSGAGLGTGGTTYNSPALQTNVPTECIITVESSTGSDITMELGAVIGRWRY